MQIGVPKEIKDNEFRVAMIPAVVGALKGSGHHVMIETGAGLGSGFSDEEYLQAGAEIVEDCKLLWDRAEMVVKVKEPIKEEYGFLKDGILLFTFLHLAGNRRLLDELLRSGGTAVAYETIETDDGQLPILTPMSEIAGRLSVQVGAHHMMKQNGGAGVLLGGVPGVEPGRVTIIGGGVVGLNAAKMAVGLGADVTIINRGHERLRYLDDVFQGRVHTLHSNSLNIAKATSECDLLIGAVHLAGAKTQKLVTREMVANMKKGSVIVDVSIDQGGCVETIIQTSHSKPTYDIDGVIHYGVANMPGSVPHTSTIALANATFPYIMEIAEQGFNNAVKSISSLKRGVNIRMGQVTHPMVAASAGKECAPLRF
ncbi:MAG: alanine dehydrogenase [Proteobacteria bacterium]|nr:alanine dehydrogenase [Pseudomonadota bacterium]